MVSDYAIALKKEEAEEDNKSLGSFFKKKPANANKVGSASMTLKKQVKETDEDDDEKPLSKKNSSVVVSKEKELKNKKTEKEEGEVKKKREKKVYDLPGQKRDHPEERDPLRIFYEALHKQVPTSDMAKIWLMECGLLPAAEAKKVLENKLQKTGKFSSPAKLEASTPRTSSKSVTEKKEARKPSSEGVSGKKKSSDSKPTTKKRKKDSEDHDDDSGDDFLANRVPKKTRVK